jgi:hypothetical protein
MRDIVLKFYPIVNTAMMRHPIVNYAFLSFGMSIMLHYLLVGIFNHSPATSDFFPLLYINMANWVHHVYCDHVNFFALIFSRSSCDNAFAVLLNLDNQHSNSN